MYPTDEQKRIAADRAEQIRGHVQEAAHLYARAVEAEDWRILGYSTIARWATEELGAHRFTTEARKSIVTMLTASGYSQRKIAAATGASQSTVKRDQQEAGESNDSPDNPRQQAARRRELRKAAERTAPVKPLSRPAAYDREALVGEITLLRLDDRPIDRGWLAGRYGCSTGTVQSLRAQVDARLALEREQAAAHQEALAAAAAPHVHEWVCRICGERQSEHSS